MKTKTNKKQIRNEFSFFSMYQEAVNSNIFVDYEKLVASSLLESNLGFESPEFKEFESLWKEAFEKKFDIILKYFIIHFNVNLKFSSDALVPTIVSVESANNEAIILKESKNPGLNLFLANYNNLIFSLLKANIYVEVFPKVIIYVSPNTNTLKILFDQKHVLYRGD
ncbi:DUF2714 domain-containing protein [Mycoplasmopsis hyopharyngis]|uniref:DUF2714 domain-containing protein n=1 Tax=Mycoplasmopsis hyopharyngis TaxID=29558 RepID=UPI003872F798